MKLINQGTATEKLICSASKATLLSCPFCGEEELIGVLTSLSVTHGRFGCERCGGSVIYYKYGTFEERDRAWNTRAK